MEGMQLNTDFSQIEPNKAGGLSFPVSDNRGHLVMIVDSGPRENSKKTGMLLVLQCQIQEGQHQGTVCEYTINYTHQNQQTQDIGQREVSAIAHCVGVLRVGNSRELHNKPFRVLVRQQKENPQYTEVYGVLDVNGNEPKKAGQGPVQSQPAQQFGGQQQQGGGFSPQGQQGGFQPGPGDQGQQQQGWSGQQGQQGQGWGGGQQQQQQQQQADPNQQQQGGQNNWQGGQQQGNGAPGWAR